MVRKHLLAVFLLFIGLCVSPAQQISTSEMADRIDLQLLLNDPAALAKVVIRYQAASDEVMFVYGTGKVLTQVHHTQMSTALVPTCSGKISSNELKQLLQAMIDHRFLDLPANSYLFQLASDELDELWKALKLHSISIDNGEFRVQRDFAAGIYQGEQQTIPADFAAVEDVLRKIRKDAIDDRPCSMARGIELPPVTPKVVH